MRGESRMRPFLVGDAGEYGVAEQCQLTWCHMVLP